MFNRSSPFPRNVLHYGRLRNTFQDDAFDERMQAIQPIRAAFTSFTPAKVYFIGGVGVSRVISYSFDSYLSTFRYEGESGFLPWTGTLVTAASMFYNTTSGVFDYLVYRKTTVDRFNLYNLKVSNYRQDSGHSPQPQIFLHFSGHFVVEASHCRGFPRLKKWPSTFPVRQCSP